MLPIICSGSHLNIWEVIWKKVHIAWLYGFSIIMNFIWLHTNLDYFFCLVNYEEQTSQAICASNNLCRITPKSVGGKSKKKMALVVIDWPVQIFWLPGVGSLFRCQFLAMPHAVLQLQWRHRQWRVIGVQRPAANRFDPAPGSDARPDVRGRGSTGGRATVHAILALLHDLSDSRYGLILGLPGIVLNCCFIMQ